MIRVVIDTGVVVSAAFRNRVPEEIILFIIEDDDFQWIASPDIVREYNEVLARKKFGIPADILDEWRRVFDRFAVVIDPEIEIDFPRDRKDAMFLECSLASDADYLITGDKDFEEAQKIEHTTILSVAQFKRLVIDRWDKE